MYSSIKSQNHPKQERALRLIRIHGLPINRFTDRVKNGLEIGGTWPPNPPGPGFFYENPDYESVVVNG